jgi:predicted RNA-binding Zn-ribbon protein involved in translation (DUF1610 family)
MNEYICPKCGSKNIEKDLKIMGNDTGDKICIQCNFIGPTNQFVKNKK